MDAAFEIPVNVPHLAASYYRIKFEDTNIRSLTFYNGLKYKLSRQNRSFLDPLPYLPGEVYVLEPVPEPEEQTKGLSIRALVKINDQWQEEQLWTEDYYKFFCFDEAAERIQELVLIISNSEYKDRSYDLKPQGLSSPTLFVSSIGCWRWVGEANVVRKSLGGAISSSAGTNVVWERVPFEEIPGATPDADGVVFLPYIAFRLKSGTMKWTMEGDVLHDDFNPDTKDVTCTHSSHATGPIKPGDPGDLEIYMFTLSDWHWDPGFSGRHGYSGWGGSFVMATHKYICADQERPVTYEGFTPDWFSMSGYRESLRVVPFKNGMMDDTYTEEYKPLEIPILNLPDFSVSLTEKWTFKPLRE
jgi:hypothetical protein